MLTSVFTRWTTVVLRRSAETRMEPTRASAVKDFEDWLIASAQVRDRHTCVGATRVTDGGSLYIQLNEERPILPSLRVRRFQRCTAGCT